MFRQYDPKEVSQICAGQIMEGFAEGTFISVERNEDSATFAPSSSGSGTRVLTSNTSGRLTLTFQQQSPSNGVLDAQRIAMELQNGGLFSFLGQDNLSGDKWSGLNAWIVKPATQEFGNEHSNREHIIETDDLKQLVTGQSA